MNDCKRLRDKVHGTEEIVPVWCRDVYEAPEEIRDVLYKEELDEIAMLQDSIGISPYDTLINGVNQIPYEREGPMEESTTVAKTGDIIDEHTDEETKEKAVEKTDKKTDDKVTVITNAINDSNIGKTKLKKRGKYEEEWPSDLSIF